MIGQRLDSIVGPLKSYAPQLQVQHTLGLDAAGWRALIAPEGSGLLTCAALEPDTHCGLPALIRAGNGPDDLRRLLWLRGRALVNPP